MTNRATKVARKKQEEDQYLCIEEQYIKCQ